MGAEKEAANVDKTCWSLARRLGSLRCNSGRGSLDRRQSRRPFVLTSHRLPACRVCRVDCHHGHAELQPNASFPRRACFVAAGCRRPRSRSRNYSMQLVAVPVQVLVRVHVAWARRGWLWLAMAEPCRALQACSVRAKGEAWGLAQLGALVQYCHYSRCSSRARHGSCQPGGSRRHDHQLTWQGEGFFLPSHEGSRLNSAREQSGVLVPDQAEPVPGSV